MEIQRQRAIKTTCNDTARMRELIAECVVGAKLWRTYLGICLTAASVVVGAVGSVLGSLSG